MTRQLCVICGKVADRRVKIYLTAEATIKNFYQIVRYSCEKHRKKIIEIEYDSYHYALWISDTVTEIFEVEED